VARPIIQLITDDAVAAIAGVSTEGGYLSNLLVSEPDHVADTPGDGVTFVHDSDWSYEENAPVGMEGLFWNFDIVTYVRGGDERNYQLLCRQYHSDIKKALMLDESRGGLARWSKVTGARLFNDGSSRGVVTTYQVYFRTLLNLPDRQS
jgi:hypothetical protein